MAEHHTDNLGTDVLRDVSRSFYLTLRALPVGMRAAISVGYLLARASDTLADCGGERAERLALLEKFRQLLGGGEAGNFFEGCMELASGDGLKDGERVLLRRLEEVFVWWQTLPAAEREAVREVVTRITAGQKWDLERFPAGEVVALSEDEELEQYCYCVAGCVGEFWTTIGFLSDERFAHKSEEEMRTLGRRYGKGLQLVNILRDEGEDEARGRRYLSGERSEWEAKARNALAEGLTYASALRNRRARMASVLPALLAFETLDLLAIASPEERASGVKVGRRVVRECLWRALFFRKRK